MEYYQPYHFALSRKLIFITTAFLFCVSLLRAQWNPAFSHYWVLKGYENPSFAGENEEIRVAVAYRSQWTGVQGSPNMAIMTADMPFEFTGQRHGVGVALFSENIGQARNNLLAGQYAFRKKIGNGSFGIGFQAGIHQLNFDAGSIHLTTDSARNNTRMIRADMIEQKIVDLNTGISWSGKNFYAGASVLHLTEPGFYAKRDSTIISDVHTDSTRTHIPRSYNFTAACNIPLFYPLEIQPIIRIQSDLSVIQVQTTLRLVYDKKFSGGASWVKDDGYVFFAGAVIQGVEAGYAYSLHTSGIGKESKGSHEVFVRYNFPIDVFNGRKPLHKSIRLL